MYKVFFNDRTLILTDQGSSSSGKGLVVHSYTNADELKKTIHAFRDTETEPQILIHGNDAEELYKRFESLFIPIEAAGGFVRNSRSEIMVIRRHDKWDLPKGKADKGERPEQTALREVTEECGIHGQDILRPLSPTFHIYFEKEDWYLKKTRWFEMKYAGEETLIPQQSEHITEVRWIGLNSLPEILRDTYPSLLDVFKEALSSTVNPEKVSLQFPPIPHDPEQ
jgi:8-oxo-dGTP pyrophosphatase MutT (NUDIX family)